MTYDHQGNPETYKDYDLEWFGRQLETIKIKDTSTIYASYTYNDSGYRTSKTVGNVTTNYFLEGDSVLYESDGSYEIYFTYDVDGQLISFYYDENKDDYIRGHEYYYIRNIQGDIVKIVDESGDILVEYKYDAWGNILDTVDNTDFDLAKMNPYRYRGYRYDEETGWYYLNSRYYNPEIRRFINADGLLGPVGGILTHNMYAYGLNSPVMNTDPSGYFVITTSLLIGAAIFGAVLGGTVAGVGAYNSGHSLGESLLIGAGGALVGGALGASMALGGAIAAGGTLFGLSTGGSIAAGLGISIGISATTGGVNSIIKQSVKNNKFTADLNRTSNDMFQSGINGALNFGIGLWMGGAGLYNIPKGSNPGIIDFGVRVTLTNIIGGGWKFANSAIFREINGETEEWRESIWRMRDWIIGY